MGLLILLLIGMVIGAYLVMLYLQNPQPAMLNLWIANKQISDISLGELILIFLGLGIALAVVLMLPAQLGLRARVKGYREEARRAQAMLEEERRRHPVVHTQSAPAPAQPEVSAPPPANTPTEETIP
jgi:hypothetical protein